MNQSKTSYHECNKKGPSHFICTMINLKIIMNRVELVFIFLRTSNIQCKHILERRKKREKVRERVHNRREKEYKEKERVHKRERERKRKIGQIEKSEKRKEKRSIKRNTKIT